MLAQVYQSTTHHSVTNPSSAGWSADELATRRILDQTVRQSQFRVRGVRFVRLSAVADIRRQT